MRSVRHRSVKFLLPLSLAAASAVACATAASDLDGQEEAVSQADLDRLLDVNDVSILFSFDQQAKSLTPAIGIDEGNLWKPAHYRQVLAFAHDVGIRGTIDEEGFPIREADRPKWQIYGMRFDPCAPGLAVVRKDASLPAAEQRFGGKCLVQLRLMAQPLFDQNDSFIPDDYAAHLTYTLAQVPAAEVATNPVVQAMVNRLVAIKQLAGNTAGKPLGVHPALASKTPATAKVARAIHDFILDAAQGKVLAGQVVPVARKIAFMGLRPGRGEWTFLAGEVDPKSDQWLPNKSLPATAAPSQSLDQVGQEDINDAFSVNPKPKNAVASTAKLFDDENAPVSVDDVKQAFTVEDPAKVDFFNTDCVSCHSSTPRLKHVQISEPSTTPGAEPTPRKVGTGPEMAARMPVPSFITGFAATDQLQDTAWNVHNFSYNSQFPSVSGRAVNETIEVVRFINEEVLQAGTPAEKRVAGPGLSCNGDGKVFACQVANGQNCFNDCKAAVTDDTPSAPISSDRGTLAPLPNHEGQVVDPCSPGHPDASKAKAIVRRSSKGATFVTLTGNNAMCISRVLRSSFASPATGSPLVSIECANRKSECTVRLSTGSAQLSGAEAERFRSVFVAPNRHFSSVGGPDSLDISCTAAGCTFTVVTK